MNAINEVLISAHSLRYAVLDNVLILLSLQTARFMRRTHYDKVSDLARFDHLTRI